MNFRLDVSDLRGKAIEEILWRECDAVAKQGSAKFSGISQNEIALQKLETPQEILTPAAFVLKQWGYLAFG
jgi:hypothetical protein